MGRFEMREVWESSEDPLATEERRFRRNHGQLLRRYAGRLVALYQGRVVGHGTDDEELARQMSSSSIPQPASTADPGAAS